MDAKKRLVFVIPLRFLGASGYMEVLCPTHRKCPDTGIEDQPAGECYVQADTPFCGVQGWRQSQS